MLEPNVCFWTRNSSCAFYTILLKRLRLTSLTDKRKPSSRFRGLRAPDRARRAGRRGAAELRRIVRRLKRILGQLGSSQRRTGRARERNEGAIRPRKRKRGPEIKKKPSIRPNHRLRRRPSAKAFPI